MGITMETPKNTYTWSYSSLSLFQQCPRKYHRVRILRNVSEQPSEHLLYGGSLHKAAEHYISNDKPLPDKFQFVQPMLDSVKNIPGTKYCEYEMGMNKKFEPCAFNAPDVWARGIADLLILNEDKARIIDYKTGNDKYADTKQLELLSLLAFKHFTEVEVVKAALMFVVTQKLVPVEYKRSDAEELWTKWITEVERLETCMNVNTWNPRQNFTCKKFCPVHDCEHNGVN